MTNISTCPVHPDHLVGTILYVLITGKIPELDSKGRPAMYFGDKRLIHDNCRRRGHFDAGEFLTDWNDPYPHADITNIDISEALKVPGVVAVITGKDLEAAGLGWLPTFHGYDKQMVLAIGKVLFQ